MKVELARTIYHLYNICLQCHSFVDIFRSLVVSHEMDLNTQAKGMHHHC